MDTPRSIISLAELRYPQDIRNRMPYFTITSYHVICFCVIEVIVHGKEALRYDVVSQMIEYLGGRQILSGFNNNQMREIFQGLKFEIMNDIGGKRRVRKREVEERKVYIRVPIRRVQVHKWGSEIHLIP